MSKDILSPWIDQNQGKFIEISDKIWDLAEIGLQEHRSAKYLTSIFEKEGFEVEKGVADMPTAFTATYGSGSPVIAILGEYDALPGLSQKPSPVKDPIMEGANGQGCNHNLLGTAGIGASLALKVLIDREELKGTVRYYGCPAEETYNAKGWMVAHGLFKDVDIGLTWHPMSYNGGWDFSTNAMNAVMFRFHGIAAHAAGDPYNGRSALDAVELMNVGINYLREHMIPDARVHYVISRGGEAPNVVPAFAESYYFVRAPQRYQVDELYERVLKVAKGAAMMTETELEVDFLSGSYNTRENSVIRDAITTNMTQIGPNEWTDEEIKFAAEMRKTIPSGAFERFIGMVPSEIKEKAKEWIEQPLCDFIIPNFGNGKVLAGSTDVADVSWNVPLAQFSTATQIMGSPGHSWQNVAAGRMAIGHKGMILAAKVLATTAYDFMTDSDLRSKAWKEFEEANKEFTYTSPFPDDHKPPFHRLTKDMVQYPDME
ncbi:MAG: M20 family metallopeptidase [Candidatus Kariarchaeaceae archaeon]|jgi:aminobenzoyl-glutamate utilization protein B